MPNAPRRPASGAGESGQAWAHQAWGQLGYLSIAHAAQWADVSPRTIKRWIKAGLPVHQAGPREKVLVRPGDIDHFLIKRQAHKVDVGALVDQVVNSLTSKTE